MMEIAKEAVMSEHFSRIGSSYSLLGASSKRAFWSDLSSALFVLLALQLAVGAAVADAQDARLYFTYGPQDRDPGSPIGILAETPTPLHLWLKVGDAASAANVCAPGATGNEICGFDLALSTVAAFDFGAFSPDLEFDRSGAGTPIVTHASPGRFAANGLDLGVPPVGSRHLGILTVATGGVSPEDAVSASGGVIAANLEMRNITAENVIVPEPGFMLSLLSGMGLVAYSGRRSRK